MKRRNDSRDRKNPGSRFVRADRSGVVLAHLHVETQAGQQDGLVDERHVEDREHERVSEGSVVPFRIGEDHRVFRGSRIERGGADKDACAHLILRRGDHRAHGGGGGPARTGKTQQVRQEGPAPFQQRRKGFNAGVPARRENASQIHPGCGSRSCFRPGDAEDGCRERRAELPMP